MKQFVDHVEIKVRGGKGGDGMISFHREKFKAKGGPDGGDGGKGGDVYLLATPNLSTLYDFRLQRSFFAQDGQKGGPNNRTGKQGKDLILKVPVGTVVYEKLDSKHQQFFTDLVQSEEDVLVAQGSRGGRGNAHLGKRDKRSRFTMRDFAKAEPGEEGEKKDLVLELKLIADIGIIGQPNAGKTTLLNFLTRASAKVGEYPFTTLSPNLGVLEVGKSDKKTRRVILADIPGLIEGASEGKGLGVEFLRHVERTKVLLHLIDGFQAVKKAKSNFKVIDLNQKISEVIWEDYGLIRKELESYSKSLGEKPEIVVINKLDITELKDLFPRIKEFFQKKDIKILGISAATGQGLEALRERIITEVQKVKQTEKVKVMPTKMKIYHLEDLPGALKKNQKLKNKD